MYKMTLLAAVCGALAYVAPAAALTAPKAAKIAAASPEFSSQQYYRPRPRLRVYPGGRLLYRSAWRNNGARAAP